MAHHEAGHIAMTQFFFGTDKYTYQIIEPFGILPDGMSWGNVSHVAVDSKDRVYAFQRKDPPIVVFDSDGNFLDSWGDGQLIDAHGIFVTPEDDLFLVDRDMYEVLKFTLQGEPLLRIGVRGKSALQAPFNHPADVAVSPGGDIYVADGYGNSMVHKFSPNGEHVLSWGGPGGEPGQFTTPHGIWWTESRGFTWRTGRTTASKSLMGRGASSLVGATSIIPWTSGWTRKIPFMSQTRCPGLQCWTEMATYWRGAARQTPATASTAIRKATCTWRPACAA